MNTIRSVGYGWVVLIAAGAGSYYFAKRSINADRAERAAAEEKRRQLQQQMRERELVNREVAAKSTSATMTGPSNAKRKGNSQGDADHPSSSKEAAGDHAPVTPEQEGMALRGKYEAAEPFRSRKGDRFS